MKAELILKSDMLDIVFENKNKDYGAYELRKQYRRRLLKSVSITVFVVIVIASLMSWKVPHKKGSIGFLPEDLVIHEIEIKKTEPPIKEPHKQLPPKQFAQVKNFPPAIVKDQPTDVHEQTDLEKKLISNIDKDGKEFGNDDVPPAVSSSGNGKTTEGITAKEVEDAPLVIAEQMPQYPGGIEALKKFIQRNTRQPDDLEEGQRIIVIAQFVVDAMGNITHIEISQKGRKDLDDEVIKVIKKMPQWIPGRQNGRLVPVYFRLPITFMPQE